MPEGNVTITATWTQLYSVTYDLGEHAADDAEAPESAWYKAGAEVTVSTTTPEAADGWVFDKWTVSENVEDLAEGKFTMPEGNVTITASWKAIYTLTYELTGGTWAEGKTPTMTVVEGTEYMLPAADAATLEGFTLEGWTFEGETYDPGAPIAVSANATIIARWSKTADDFTSTGWWVPSATSVLVSYGQTVTVTGDMVPMIAENQTAHVDYEGIFVSIGKAEGSDPVSVMMLFTKNLLNNNDGTNYGGAVHSALGTKTTTDANLYTKNGEAWDDATYELTTIAAMMGGTISGYTAVVDYTVDGKVVVTTTFISVVGETTYKYVGVATSVAANPHVGLAQNYRVTFAGEKNSKFNNGKFVVEGKAGTIAEPVKEHNWVNGVCSLCSNECDHAGASATKCDTCGATIATSPYTDTTASNTTGWHTAEGGLLSGIGLNNNQVIIITGTQTKTMTSTTEANPQFFSLIIETTTAIGNVGLTFRTDSYGWTYGEGTVADVLNGTYTATNSLTDAQNAAYTGQDYWTKIAAIQLNCDWTVKFSLRDTKLTISLTMVGKDGDVAGFTYNTTYTVNYKATPADGELVFLLGFDCGTAVATITETATSKTMYSWAN